MPDSSTPGAIPAKDMSFEASVKDVMSPISARMDIPVIAPMPGMEVIGEFSWWLNSSIFFSRISICSARASMMAMTDWTSSSTATLWASPMESLAVVFRISAVTDDFLPRAFVASTFRRLRMSVEAMMAALGYLFSTFMTEASRYSSRYCTTISH